MVDDDFMKMIEKLQQKVEYEEEKKYSKVVIEEFRNPSHYGILKNADTIGEIKGPCGDTMKISLKIKKDVIEDGCFWTDGCGATIAAGNMLIKMILGKTIENAKKITSERLLEALHGLPKEHRHCAVLTVNTFNYSIEQYQIKS